RLTAENAAGRRLHASHAFHSAMMDSVVGPFREAVERVARRAPAIPLISNVTGTWMTEAQATSADYWARHLRQPVRFADGVEELLKDTGRVFLEVGPASALATFVRQSGHELGTRQVLTTLRHPYDQQADLAVALETLGRLWLDAFG